MRIINIVDNLKPVNYGIWKAAVVTAPALKRDYGISSEVWFPQDADAASAGEMPMILPRSITDTGLKGLDKLIAEADIKPSTDLIVSHGSWRFPTKWAFELKKRGFKWIYTPQGMLEPWSMEQKKLKKQVYLALFEKPQARKADVVRAVSTPEQQNLGKIFDSKKIQWIPNGVEIPPLNEHYDKGEKRRMLFMARLHQKKGVMRLTQAWITSTLLNHDNFELIIAGPDDGEERRLRHALKHYFNSNIKYVGPVYGKEKENLLKSSTYYVLPSHSEGFPSSVVEAMGYGLVPLISHGCNFPQAFDEGLATLMEPDRTQMRDKLAKLKTQTDEQIADISKKSRQFIHDNFTVDKVAQQQAQLCEKLLNG